MSGGPPESRDKGGEGGRERDDSYVFHPLTLVRSIFRGLLLLNKPSSPCRFINPLNHHKFEKFSPPTSLVLPQQEEVPCRPKQTNN